MNKLLSSFAKTKAVITSLAFTVALVAAVSVVAPKPASATTCQQVSNACDSAVVFNTMGYDKTVTLNTAGDVFGDCTYDSGAGTSFVVPGTSHTCTGVEFGQKYGVKVTLASVPAGYTFIGFTTNNNGASFCTGSGSSSYCTFSFTQGSMTVNINFKQNVAAGTPSPTAPTPTPTPAPQPTTPPAAPAPNPNPGPAAKPAAPSAPILAVTGSSPSSVTLTWSQPTIPGGLKQYEIYANNVLLGSVTSRSVIHVDLSCGQTRGYKVRVVDNLGQFTDSNTVNGSTTACPAGTQAVSTNNSSGGSITTAGSSNNSSSNNSGGKLADTGPGEVVSLFTATSAGAGAAHHVFNRRRKKFGL